MKETIKKNVFIEEGGSKYAEYIPKPKWEKYSMRTKQELPTGPHTDWRKFEIRDYVEDSDYMKEFNPLMIKCQVGVKTSIGRQ